MSGEDKDRESLTSDSLVDTSDDKLDDTLDASADESLTATIVLSDDDSDVAISNSTVEMDIEKLVEKLDSIDSEDVHRKAEVRHKLEELREVHDQELDSTFNLNFDDDD